MAGIILTYPDSKPNCNSDEHPVFVPMIDHVDHETKLDHNLEGVD